MTGRCLPAGLHGHTALQIGDRIETGEAVITASMIDQFADLSGDHFALHLNDDAARALGFPRRVAHGLLVLSVIDGLKNTAPAQLRAVASLGWDIRFSAPVLVHARLKAAFTIDAIRPARDGQRGVVTLGVVACQQDGTVVQRGSTTLMMLP